MGREMRINYRDVMNKAKKMQNKSLELSYQIIRLENIEQSISQQWKGPASTVFQRKLVQLIRRMRAVKNELSDTAELIEITAKAIHQADMEAKKKAKQL